MWNAVTFIPVFSFPHNFSYSYMMLHGPIFISWVVGLDIVYCREMIRWGICTLMTLELLLSLVISLLRWGWVYHISTTNILPVVLEDLHGRLRKDGYHLLLYGLVPGRPFVIENSHNRVDPLIQKGQVLNVINWKIGQPVLRQCPLAYL